MADENLNVVVSLKDRASAGLASTRKSMQQFGSAAADASKKFAVAMTALGVAGGFAVKEFGQFEKQMSKVKAITEANQKEFKQLTELALDMGRTTQFTAKEAGDAMQFLGMAGFTTNEIMKSLQGTMHLAAATGVDLGTSADIVSNVIQGFGRSAEETSRFVDVLAKTTTSSNTNLVELGEAMKFAAPASRALGVTVEETSAALGLLGNAGIKGTLAGTGLQRVLVRLAADNKTRDMLKELGVKAFDTAGEFVGLTEFVKRYEEATSDMTQQQKLFAAESIAGLIGLKSWLSLVEAGSEELARYTRTLELSEGAARKMATTMLDNLIGSFTLFKSALSGLLIEVGSRFSPALREMLGGFTDLANNVTSFLQDGEKLNKFFEENRKTIEIVAAAIAGILIPAVASLTIAFGSLVASLAPFAILGVAAFEAWRTNFLGLRDAVSSGIEFMTENFGMFKDFVIERFFAVTEWIKLNVIPTLEFLKEKWNSNFLGIKIITKAIFDTVVQIAKFFLTSIKDIFSIGLALIRGDWQTVWDGIVSIVRSAAEVVMGIVNRIIGAITTAIRKLKELVGAESAQDATTRQRAAISAGAASGVTVPTGFANGGIVHERFAGGGIAGDSVPAMLTPGEVILNAAQQKRLAGQMSGITINITGNTLLDEESAEKIGDLIVQRLNFHAAT